MNRTLALAICLSLALVPTGTAAQSDWLKRGGELLRNLPGGGGSPGAAALSDAEIGNGLREALRVGVGRVVDQVGAVDGYNADPKIHIPLPDSLKTVQSTLARVGLSGMMDDLELRLNRAAETAAPEARAVFWNAIEQMTLDDVRAIYNGPDDAATRYFERTMTPDLKSRMRPIVDDSLADVGAIQAYDAALGRYRNIPFVPDAKADLTDHVLDLGLQGIFLYLAAEEKAIRENPAKRTTELLRKVFSR
ncbi:MAG: DUF4197 domain-containing protein [Alphaproteobacteria bacterium]|nr:DUF4197 domain-containing protein [Alphaproteobacteria bacterium]